MNETAPLQKQDLDRVVGLLEAILKELRTISETHVSPTIVFEVPKTSQSANLAISDRP